jgi:hypothetical protein
MSKSSSIGEESIATLHLKKTSRDAYSAVRMIFIQNENGDPPTATRESLTRCTLELRSIHQLVGSFSIAAHDGRY